MRHFLLKSNKKGSALVMVLVASLALAAFALVLMQRKKTEANMNVHDTAERDLQTAISRISTLLLSPADCNATFMGRGAVEGTNYNIDYLKKCEVTAPTVNCRTSGTSVNAISKETVNWFFEGKPMKVRVKQMSYKTQNQGILPRKVGVLTLTVKFEKNLGMVNGAIRVAEVSRDFSAFISTGNYTFPPSSTSWSPGTTILGCTNSQSSTVVY